MNLLPSDIARFQSKYTKGPGCWEWRKGKDKGGYGKFYAGQSHYRAHRVAFTISKGPVDALNVLHTCDNPSCVNPDHLFAGTTVDNVADKVAKGRQAKGEGCNRKLTDIQVRAIRSDDRPLRLIAQDHGISKSMAGMVKQRRYWKHVQ